MTEKTNYLTFSKNFARALLALVSAATLVVFSVSCATSSGAAQLPDGGVTALMKAVSADNVPEIKRLLSDGEDVDSSDARGNTALHYAASDVNYSDTLPLLLAAGADVNARNLEGKTPLMEAARMGYFDAVKKLVDAGADVNIIDNRKRSVMSFAAMAKNKSYQIFTYLIEKGGRPTPEPDYFGKTPLILALEEGNTPTALYVIENIPDFNMSQEATAAGMVAMKIAIFEGNRKVVEKIVEKKLPLNADMDKVYRSMEILNMEGVFEIMGRNGIVKDGKTPLFWAAEADNPELVTFLIKSGARKNQVDNAGVTPRQYARKRATLRAFDNTPEP